MSVKRILWLHGERLLLRGLLRESTRCWLLLASELEVGLPELLLKMGSTLGQKGKGNQCFAKCVSGDSSEAVDNVKHQSLL